MFCAKDSNMRCSPQWARGDYWDDMNKQRRPRQAVIDRAVTERDLSSIDDRVVATLVADVRQAIAGAAPSAEGELATMLAEGHDPAAVGTHTGDQFVPVPPPSRSTDARRPRMVEFAFAKIAGLTVAAKIGLAGAALAASTTGAGAAGVLPAPAQEAFDRVAVFGTTSDDEEVDELADLENGESTEVAENGNESDGSHETEDERAEPGPVSDAVREVIEGTDPQDRDADFGQEVAETASQNRQDTAARNGDETDDADDDNGDGSGLQERQVPAPVTPPAGPPAGGQGPPQG